MSRQYYPIPPIAQGHRATVMAWIANTAAGMTEHEATIAQHGAAIAALGGSSGITVPSGESLPVQAGAPIAVLSGMGRLATAASLSLARPVGLALAVASPTNPITIVPDGQQLELSTGQWQQITGEVGGLSPGLTYFVGATVGTLTNAPPTSSGQVVCVVGRALSTTVLLVDVGEPVLL